MTDRELNEIIDWCRKNLTMKRKNSYGLTGKRMEGYEQAMKAVMSYIFQDKKKKMRRIKRAVRS